MIQTSYINITSAVTANQIAELLGLEHYQSGNYEVFHVNGNSESGFAISGIGSTSWSIYPYFNTAVQSTLLETISSRFYYNVSKYYILFGSSAANQNIIKGFIKGKSNVDGSEAWECISMLTNSINTGYAWGKTSTYLEGLSRTMTLRSAPNLLPLCPFFNLATGFYTDGGVYYATHIQNTITAQNALIDITMNGKNYVLVTNNNLAYMNPVFEVEN